MRWLFEITDTHRVQQCNGRPELCNRKYGNITFLGSHDSFAISGNPLAREFCQALEGGHMNMCYQWQETRKSTLNHN